MLKEPVEDLEDLAKLTLQNSYFEFDKIYKQKLDAGIGSKFSSSFANILMLKLERRMSSIQKQPKTLKSIK